MAGNRSQRKKAVGIILTMFVYALLFFVTVMTVTGYLDKRYGKAGEGAGSPTPAKSPDEPPGVTAELLIVPDAAGELFRLAVIETDCVNAKLRINVIPMDTRLNLSATLYRECTKINVKTPQLTTVGEFYKCFGNAAPEMTARAVRELLPFSFDYVTVMPKSLYLTVFAEFPEDSFYRSFLADDLADRIAAENGLYGFIKTVIAGCDTTKTLREAMFCLETYEGLTERTATCRLIPGARHNNGYEVSGDPGYYYKRMHTD